MNATKHHSRMKHVHVIEKKFLKVKIGEKETYFKHKLKDMTTEIESQTCLKDVQLIRMQPRQRRVMDNIKRYGHIKVYPCPDFPFCSDQDSQLKVSKGLGGY